MDKLKELESQIKVQNVLQSELSQLKSKSNVYRKQQNSDIFFLSSVEQEMHNSKRTLDNLLAEYKTLQQTDKESP